MSFRAKLFLAIGALVVLVLVSSSLVVGRQAEKLIVAKITNDFKPTLQIATNLVAQRVALFNRVADDLGSNPLFTSAVNVSSGGSNDLGIEEEVDTGAQRAEAHNVLASVLPDLPFVADRALFLAADSSGALLYDQGDQQRFGDSLGDLELVRAALKDRLALTLWDRSSRALGIAVQNVRGGDEVLLAMARPVRVFGAVRGAFVAADGVSEIIREVEAVATSRFALLSEGGRLATTFGIEDAARRRQLEVAAASGAVGLEPRILLLSGERHLVVLSPLSVEGSVIGRALLFRSLDAELAPFLRSFQRVLWVVGILFLVAGLGFAAVLARGIARPIRTLAAAARQVRAGDLEAKVPVRGKDEIADLGGAFNEMVSGLKMRDVYKATFKRFVSPAVAEELLKDPSRLGLGGQKREVTIMFSDLVGFTTLSEKSSAEQLVTLLNEYLTEVNLVLSKYEGTLDKYVGDAVMAFWSAPVEQADQAERACLAALDHLEVIRIINDRWRPLGRPTIDCRIGVNTGEVIVGNIGSEANLSYTAIGDAVNLASRLEGANKYYGTRCMCAETTWEKAQGAVEGRELDSLRVKGKSVPVKIYEILAPRGALGDEKRQVCGLFAEGLAAYRALDFAQAIARFQAALALDPNDGPSRVFLERSQEFQAQPPPQGWDGVHDLDAK